MFFKNKQKENYLIIYDSQLVIMEQYMYFLVSGRKWTVLVFAYSWF